MRFLARLRTWEFRQLPAIHRCSKPTRPDKARRVGYKAWAGVLFGGGSCVVADTMSLRACKPSGEVP